MKIRRKRMSELMNQSINQLNRVGLADNRPSNDKLHHFVQKRTEKKEEKKNVTCDT